MREYRYEKLLEMPYSEIAKITASHEQFKVVAEDRAGRRISRFLENEDSFARSDKSLRSRLTYLAGGLIGMLIPNFMPLWNRAMMDGFFVESVDQLSHNYEIVFAYKKHSNKG